MVGRQCRSARRSRWASSSPVTIRRFSTPPESVTSLCSSAENGSHAPPQVPPVRSRGVRMKRTCLATVVATLVSLPAAAQQPFTVVTYNTQNGTAPTSQMHQIALLSPQADAVVLEEAQVGSLQTYLDALNSEY